MTHRLLVGNEGEGPYVSRAEWEQLLAALATWQAKVPASDAQFFVAAASPDLSAERVGVNSPTVRVDYGIAGQVKWHADQAAFGAGYMMAGFGAEDGADGPPGRDGVIGTNGATGAQGPMGGILTFDGVDGEDCWMPGPQGPTGPTSPGFWSNVIASSDQDIASNTTVANDNELFFTLTAAKLYAFEAHLLYSSPVGGGTPDFKWAYNGPATLTGSAVVFSDFIATNETQGTAQAGQTLATANQVGTATTPRLVHQRGWAYSTGGGTGSSGLILQWAQVTSGVNPTRRHAGSVLRWRQIST